MDPPGTSQAGRCAKLRRTLADPATYKGRPAVSVYETHASCVFVAGARAYKIKKPVALGFLDYSTLARRRRACEEEVRVNQALAPGLYLGVRAIVESAAGLRFADADAPGAVEYAVEMRRFNEQDTLAGAIAAGALEPAQIEATARLIAAFHRSAPVVRGWGPEQVRERWRVNLEDLRRTAHPEAWRLEVPARFASAFLGAHAEQLRRRGDQGFARDGHGDLRCEHVLLRPLARIVDRIEFDPNLRRADVACDLAFLAMDLEARGQRWAAEELFEDYERVGLDCGEPRLRAFYACHWALVRAKVAAIAGAEEEAQRMWSLAERLRWRARHPVLLVLCGPAASGKSVLAHALARAGEMPVFASDVARKRLAGVGVHEQASPEHYGAEFTQATYRQLGRGAARRLRDGESAIVDATCRSRADRALLLAELTGARRLFVRCSVPLELARERAARRACDPHRVSDATPQIVEQQFASFEELDELPADALVRVDGAQPVKAQIAQVELALDRAP
ncbi:MAG TPA: AAA family ATPase [Solirubrobacteraceae bacterium]|jgi:hypothetical protein|nr:AAA family ATPase [Solirubrobacteraceae bacterium]